MCEVGPDGQKIDCGLYAGLNWRNKRGRRFNAVIGLLLHRGSWGQKHVRIKCSGEGVFFLGRRPVVNHYHARRSKPAHNLQARTNITPTSDHDEPILKLWSRSIQSQPAPEDVIPSEGRCRCLNVRTRTDSHCGSDR